MTETLISWPGGSLEATLKLGGAMIAAYAIILWISAVVWTFRDVRMRTTDPLSQAVAVLLVSLFSLPGLIVYLVIRPQETIADAYERSLEAEAILHELQLDTNACQTCRRGIDPDFNVCPHCKTILREPCRSCARLVRTNWAACPYCTADRAPARQPLRQPTQHVQPLQAPTRQGNASPARENTPARGSLPQRSAQGQARPPTPLSRQGDTQHRPAPAAAQGAPAPTPSPAPETRT
jgi:RNA polymerase subunit RPABC4/transcription elongation factor Spt4